MTNTDTATSAAPLGAAFDDMIATNLIEEGVPFHAERPDGEKLFFDAETGRFTTSPGTPALEGKPAIVNPPVLLIMRSTECKAYRDWIARQNREQTSKMVAQRGNQAKANAILVDSITKDRDPERFAILCAGMVNIQPGSERAISPPPADLATFAARNAMTRHMTTGALNFAADLSNYSGEAAGLLEGGTARLEDQSGNDAPSI